MTEPVQKSVPKQRRRPSKKWSLLGIGLIFFGGSAIAAVSGEVWSNDDGWGALPSSISNSLPDLGSSASGGLSIPGINGSSVDLSHLPKLGGLGRPSDWLNGSDLFGDLFGGISGVSQKENEIFDVMQESVFGHSDVLTGQGGQPVNPFELRLPSEDSDAGNPPEVSTPGVITSAPIVRRRDVANLYDQTAARSAAAPYLGAAGDEWLAQEVESSSKIMQSASENVTQAANIAQGANELTSTQDVLKQTTQVNALIANQLAMSEAMEAENNEALLAIQRISAINAGLAANNGEALDESNRRERFARQLQLNGSVSTTLYVPGLNESEPSAERDEDALAGARSPIQGER